MIPVRKIYTFMENFAHDFRELNLASETLPWTNIKNLVIKLVLEGKVCVYLCIFQVSYKGVIILSQFKKEKRKKIPRLRIV